MQDAKEPKTYDENQRVDSDFRLRCPAAAALRLQSAHDLPPLPRVCFRSTASTFSLSASANFKDAVKDCCWTLRALMTTWGLWTKIARVNRELYVLLWRGRARPNTTTTASVNVVILSATCGGQGGAVCDEHVLSSSVNLHGFRLPLACRSASNLKICSISVFPTLSNVDAHLAWLEMFTLSFKNLNTGFLKGAFLSTNIRKKHCYRLTHTTFLRGYLLRTRGHTQRI